MNDLPRGAQRLSSNATSGLKWGVPAMMTVGTIVIVYLVLRNTTGPFSQLIVPMGGLVVVMMLVVASLLSYVDEVYRLGDQLFISNFGKQRRIDLVDVESMKCGQNLRGGPCLVSLKMKQRHWWGARIRFYADYQFSRTPLPVNVGLSQEIADLQDRVKQLNGRRD